MVSKRELLYYLHDLEDGMTALGNELSELQEKVKHLDNKMKKSPMFHSKEEEARLKQAIQDVTEKRKPGRPRKSK